MSLPTLLLTPMLAAVLLVVAAMVVRLARSWGDSAASARVAREDADRIALEDARDRALTTLKDLEHEFRMGKLDERDYEELRSFYEHEAVRLMAALDAHGRPTEALS